MATKRAVEGSALVFSAAGSWSGGAPASTNDLIIGEGFFTYTSGFALGAVNAASLKVHGSARCEIGGPGSIGPLVMDVNNSGAGIRWGPADGVLYFSGATNLLSQESARAPIYLLGGAHAVLSQSAGRVEVGADATLATVYALDGSMKIAATSGSDVIDDLYIVDAVVETWRSVKRVHISGKGHLILQDGATIADTGSGYARVLDARAKISVRGNTDITIDLVDGLVGTLDPSAMEGALTLTAAKVTPRFNLIRDSLQGRITVTTETPLGTPGRFAGAVSAADV